jgi:hypothetical protein
MYWSQPSSQIGAGPERSVEKSTSTESHLQTSFGQGGGSFLG